MKKGNAKHFQLKVGKERADEPGVMIKPGADAKRLKKKGVVSPGGEVFPIGPRTSIQIIVPENLTGEARQAFIQEKINKAKASMRKVV